MLAIAALRSVVKVDRVLAMAAFLTVRRVQHADTWLPLRHRKRSLPKIHMCSELVGMPGFEPGTPCSQSQSGAATTTASARLTSTASSFGAHWRPPLATAIVAHLVTRMARRLLDSLDVLAISMFVPVSLDKITVKQRLTFCRASWPAGQGRALGGSRPARMYPACGLTCG